MTIAGICHPFKAREQGFELHVIELTVGASGAVTSVDGKGMATDGTAVGELGGVVRNAAGDYTITLPGYGGVQKLVPRTPVILDGAVVDAKVPLLAARTASARTFQWHFVDVAAGIALEELTDGTVVLFEVLVKQGSAE